LENGRKTQRNISILCACMILMSFAWSPVLAGPDVLPPDVVWTDPVNQEIRVNPATAIEVVIRDYDPQFMNDISGIDISTVTLRMQDQAIPFFVDVVGNDSVFVHSNLPVPMPAASWIKIEVNAADKAGNKMAPYIWSFMTEGLHDEIPPQISGQSPPDGCIGVVRNAQISCKIEDDLSGIDTNSITMYVNGKNVALTLVGSYHSLKVYYQNEEPFDYGTWVNIVVSAADNAGNVSESNWSFQTEYRPIQPPRLISPGDDALLNFQKEEGVIRFNWTYQDEEEFYRLILVMVDFPAMEEIDIGPGDYEINHGHFVELRYELTEAEWLSLAEMGGIRWSVVKIDGYGGFPISGPSNEFVFNVASPYVVVLRSPEKYQEFKEGDAPPIFWWDSYNGVESYQLGIARVGTGGQMVTDVIEFDVDGSRNSFFLNYQLWDGFDNGKYIWSVIGIFPDRSRTEFMNYYFLKTNRGVLRFLLPPPM
jgi:Bacterial Ig-like domain